MRVHRPLVASLLAISVWGADAAPAVAPAPAASQPLAEVRLADGTALNTHWQASLYGRIWQDPACAPLREHVTTALNEAGEKWGVHPLDLIAALNGAALRLDGIDPVEGGTPLPRLIARADVGAHATAVFTALTSHLEASTDAAVAGADQSVQLDDKTKLLARFGSLLVAAFQVPMDQARAWKPTPADADVAGSIDLIALKRTLLALLPDKAADFSDLDELGQVQARASLVPEGIHEVFTTSHASPGSQTLDLAQLKRLPATTLLTLGFGLDGAVIWQAKRDKLLTQLATALNQPDAAATEAHINEQLKAFGLTHTIADLITGWKGTSFLAVTQGMPFPGVSLMVPRSPAIDELVTVLLTQVQSTVPPEGGVMPVTVPGMPLPLNIARDAGHWLITSDPLLGNTWTSGEPGGWADSAAGKAALAHAGERCVVLGSSDTPTIIRTIAPLLQMTGTAKPQDLAALNTLASMVSTGWLAGRLQGEGSVIEDQGVTGFTGLIAGGAALAATFANQHTDVATAEDAEPAYVAPTAEETAAAEALRTTLLPAEIRFQAEKHVDQDGDGVGEFGLLDELTGVRPTMATPAAKLALLPADFADVHGGYRFIVYLPDGRTGDEIGAIDTHGDPTSARPANAAAAKAQARRFVAYAWPASDEVHGRVLAITQAGTVYGTTMYSGEPEWNALTGGDGWEAEATWEAWPPKAPEKTNDVTVDPGQGADQQTMPEQAKPAEQPQFVP
jgi:hypothetical protein